MVRASHLLIKHQGSRNPVSRRTNQSTSGVTKEAAIAELKTYEAKLKCVTLFFLDAAHPKRYLICIAMRIEHIGRSTDF